MAPSADMNNCSNDLVPSMTAHVFRRMRLAASPGAGRADLARDRRHGSSTHDAFGDHPSLRARHLPMPLGRPPGGTGGDGGKWNAGPWMFNSIRAGRRKGGYEKWGDKSGSRASPAEPD
jgi:hypothetical protein